MKKIDKINIKKLLLNENYDNLKDYILDEFDNTLKNNKTITEVIEMTKKYAKINSMSRFISAMSENDSKDDKIDDEVADEIKEAVENTEVDDEEGVVEGLRYLKRLIAKTHNRYLIKECGKIIDETEVDDPEDVKESLISILRQVNILSEADDEDDEEEVSEADDSEDDEEKADDKKSKKTENDVKESIRMLDRAITICEETDDEDEDEIAENFSRADDILERVITKLSKSGKNPMVKSILENEVEKEVDDKEDVKEACISYIKSLKKAKSILEADDSDYSDDDEYRDENGNVIEHCTSKCRATRKESDLRECLTSTLSKFL